MQEFKIGAFGATVTVTDRAVIIKSARTTVIPLANIADTRKQLGSVVITDNAGKRHQFGSGKRGVNGQIVDAILAAM
jgi:hypothetical protein